MSDRKQILALSGGGARGVFSARMLERLEDRSKGQPLATRFDLIAGTSVGGIIALGIAAEIPAKKIRETIEKVAPIVFANRPKVALSWKERFLLKCLRVLSPAHARLVDSALDKPYDPEPLRKALQKLFGNKKIADLPHNIVVPVVNFSTGRPKLFKTSHDPSFTVDGMRKVVDVALATSAAPVFFPHHEIEGNRFVDGGLIANGPTLFALHEATHFLKWNTDTTHMLSIGTLDVGACDSASTPLDKGLVEWGEKLFTLTISAQEQAAHFMTGHILGDRFQRLDEVITKDQSQDVGFDKADDVAITTMKARADERFQVAIGQQKINDFLAHQAQKTARYDTGK